ncbi:MAG TPA: metabolite traffic protein EboE [Syntrophales bacterium]|nr:metabolite traffic protein EboE [Syntrophales bacterium]
MHEKPAAHLTYCLNVHPGERWEDNYKALNDMTLKIRDRVAPEKKFGIGLRLSRLAAYSLASSETLNQLEEFLRNNHLYVFSINGFPYGDFHETVVKENVYYPDWRTRKRRDYTIQLSDILSKLIPPYTSGSISTVPGSYKNWIQTESDHAEMIYHMMDCVAHLASIRQRTGKDLHMGLEPEPDCFLETTRETVSFFTGELLDLGRPYLAQLKGCRKSQAEEMIFRHLGVCFDTCHMSLQFENLAESISILKANGIRLSKIQISAALKTTCAERNLIRLKDFSESVYLHQVKTSGGKDGSVSYGDLSRALENIDLKTQTGEDVRVHFHVPLYYTGDDCLESTAADLTPDFFSQALDSGAEHFEIETYSFNVLPEDLKKKGLVESVVDEYVWVINRFPKEKLCI